MASICETGIHNSWLLSNSSSAVRRREMKREEVIRRIVAREMANEPIVAKKPASLMSLRYWG
jgi:hypothetical protein